MSTRKFAFLDKRKLDEFLPNLFEILYSNMSLIAPTGNSYDEDLEVWCSYMVPDMKREQRQVVLMYVDNILAGFFRYNIDSEKDSLMMEEIQIKKEFQGTGLFSAFYKWLVQQIPQDILHVEAYANKKNDKSQAVLKHLGLVQLGENKNGLSFYYKGKYVDLFCRYSCCE